MSNIALYRTHRPQKFKDVLGQDHIVSILEASIANNKISHAYIFGGSRGIGKTTIARIFAKEIGTSPNDIYEIDAASNRGIDDIRAIREAVHTMPLESKYKVYIIDEAHMLTKDASNALLKTLEEPPAHVIFIFATTEMHKILDTIISRCQVFEFKKPTVEILSTTIKNVAKKEGCTIDEASARLIAIMADGAYRDALGILEQVIGATKGNEISYENTARMLGAPESELINNYIMSVLEKKPELGIEAIKSIKEKGTNISIFASMVLAKLRTILLLRFNGIDKKELNKEYSDSDVSFVEKVAGNSDLVLTSGQMIAFIEAIERIANTSIPELPLELFILDNAKD